MSSDNFIECFSNYSRTINRSLSTIKSRLNGPSLRRRARIARQQMSFAGKAKHAQELDDTASPVKPAERSSIRSSEAVVETEDGSARELHSARCRTVQHAARDTAARSHLVELPLELQLEILSYLGAVASLNLRETCSHLRAVVPPVTRQEIFRFKGFYRKWCSDERARRFSYVWSAGHPSCFKLCCRCETLVRHPRGIASFRANVREREVLCGRCAEFGCVMIKIEGEFVNHVC